MKEGGWGTSGGRHRIQGLFVAVEVAIACLLLVGAGLMIRSLARLWSVDPGLNPHHVLAFGVTLPPGLGKDPDAVRRMLTDVDRKLEEIPGVTAVSINDGGVPFTGDESDVPFWCADRPKPASQNQMDDALFYIVQPGYLAAMQIPLLRGRFFTEQDGPQSPPVAVIDQDFADRIYPHQNPLGQRLNVAILGTQPEIIGIVGHVKHFGLDETPGQGLLAQFYFPVNQIPDRFTPLLDRSAEVLVRTSGAPEDVIPAVRRQMQSMDKDEVVYDAQPLDSIVADSLAVRRYSMIVLDVFAALALALAAIGIYGVISYLTAQRTQEFGIRMALGAGPGSILGLVVRQGGGMAGLGVVVGLAAAAALTRLMKSLLFGVGVRDPITMLAVGTVVMAVAVLACGLPARRATRVDPTTALRYE